MADNAALALEAKEAGNAAYKKKDFETALKEYDRAIELNPSEMTFLTNKAAVFYEQKEYQQCIDQCSKAVEVGRENRADYKLIAKAYSRMAAAYKQMDDLANAKVYYQKSLSEHRIPDTVTKLAEIDKILKDKERLAYLDPQKALEAKALGNELFQKGDYPGAIKHYSEAIKRNPEDSKLYSNRAACYQKLAEFHLALKDCEQCIALEPTFVRGHLRKGYAQLALKEYSKAMDTFQKALELDPNCGEAQDGARKCMESMGSNPEEARKRAMNDPEIQQIFSDPAMRLILEQMQSDPKALSEHLKNPDVAAKIEKLLSAGLIGFR